MVIPSAVFIAKVPLRVENSIGSPLEGEILQVLEVRPLMCQMIQMMEKQVETTPQKTILSMRQEL